MLESNVTTPLSETALSILLRLILQTSFQNVRCVIYSNSHENDAHFHFPIRFDVNTSFANNPQHCIPGCSHYILHNPSDQIPSWIDKCLLQNGDYTFRAIILLNSDNVDMYVRKAYASDAIFIFRENDYFTIAAFEDWEATQMIVLNQWCIKTKSFLRSKYSTVDFFSGKWKNNKRSAFLLPYQTVIPVYWRTTAGRKFSSGSNYHLLKQFALTNKFTLIDDSEQDPIFAVTHRDTFRRNDSIYSYPITGIEITFLVPKPKYVSSQIKKNNLIIERFI